MSSDLRADERVHRGLAASRGGDSSSAIGLFREASAIDPDSPVPHLLLGAELAQLGKVEEAEAAYANALLLAPDFDVARFQLGLLQFTSGRVPIALLTWAPLLQRQEDEPLQRFVSGFVALAQDDFRAAMDCFREGLQLSHPNKPLNADIRMLMARIEPLASTHAASAPPARGTDVHVLLSNYERQRLDH